MIGHPLLLESPMQETLDDTLSRYQEGIDEAYEDYKTTVDDLYRQFANLPHEIIENSNQVKFYYAELQKTYERFLASGQSSDAFVEYYQTICFLEDTLDTLLMESPPPPEDPCPAMSPPLHQLLYAYTLKYPIHPHTANVLWSIDQTLYYQDAPSIQTLLFLHPIDLDAFHEKIAQYSILHSIRCFDTVYLLPFYSILMYSYFNDSPTICSTELLARSP